MLKILQCRINTKPLTMANEAPKPPLQSHLLHSHPCLLIASHLTSSLIQKEPFFPPPLVPLHCCFSCLGHPTVLQICTWLTPVISEAQLKHDLFREAFLGLSKPNQHLSPSVPSVTASASYCSQYLLRSEIILFYLFTYLLTISLSRLYSPEKQGPFFFVIFTTWL